MSTPQKSRLVQFSSTELFTDIYAGFWEKHWEYGLVKDDEFFQRLLDDPEKFDKVFDDELFSIFEELSGEAFTGDFSTRPSIKKDGDKITVGIFGTVFNIEEFEKCEDAHDYVLPTVISQLRDKGSDYFYECLMKTWKDGMYPAYAYIPAGDSETLIEIIKTCTGNKGWRGID